MYVTLHLSDGRKITKDKEKLDFFKGSTANYVPEPVEGSIWVNLEHVVDMRPAEEDEIKHAKIHGY